MDFQMLHVVTLLFVATWTVLALEWFLMVKENHNFVPVLNFKAHLICVRSFMLFSSPFRSEHFATES